MKLKEFWSLLREATKLDIYDLAYEYSSEDLKLLLVAAAFWDKKNGFPRKGVLVRISIFFWHFCQRIAEHWRRTGSAVPPGSFVFFALSKNERDSLKPVCAQIPNAYLTGNDEMPFPFPFIWAYAISCPFLPLVFIHLLKARGYRRTTFPYIFDHYWLSYGLYVVARAWLRRVQPKAFILGNETYTYHRVMTKAAIDEGIRTVHLQHSTNPDKLPPLTHDYALLEGQDNLDKLVQVGAMRTRIFLVGAPKHDAHFQHLNVQKQVRSIGICANILDPVARAEELIARIRQGSVNLPIVLRPHNADIRLNEWQELATKYDIEFSDSKQELSFDFLMKVDAIVAGDSNILLEAALMNVFPLYYDFAQAHLDWYGFQRNGLAEYFSELELLYDRIRELAIDKPDVRKRAKFYCATIGTPYDGRSGELAAALIQSLGFGSDFDRSLWKRIPEIDLEAYGINNGS